MLQFKRLSMWLVMTSWCGMSGCSVLHLADAPPPPPPVYMPPGSIAEVAELTRVACWITNAETGKREKRVVEAQPGYWLARPRVQPFQSAP